jgi:hypothetical protein
MGRASMKLLALVIATAIGQVVLGSAWIEVFADVDPDSHSVMAFLYGPASALSWLALPFLLGYLIGRRGFLSGAFVGLIAAPIQLLLTTHNAPSLGLAPQLVSAGTGSAITCAVASAAGVLAKGMSSNKSFKPNPLRGSA